MERFQGSRSSTRHSFFTLGTALAITLSSLILAAPRAQAMPAEYAVGPDSNFELLLTTLDSTQKKIVINIYEFNNPIIAEHLIRKVKEGIEVQILFETQPCCDRKMTELGKKVVRDLYTAMRKSGRARHRIFLMGSRLKRSNDLPVAPVASPTPSVRRYIYNHAKYLIIDGSRVHMSSENFTVTGHPETGTVGNRGWDVALENPAMATKLLELFKIDSDPNEKDILEIQPTRNTLPGWLRADGSSLEPESNPERSAARVAPETGTATQVDLVTSPDALAGIEKFMDYADHTLDLQFMSFPLNWGRGQNAAMSPLVEKVILLAKSGVAVRVLLNDPRTFEPNSDVGVGNEITVAMLEKIGKCRGFDLNAKIIDVENVEVSYIHNKGILVDDDRVLVSSVNGTQNSVESNRETAFSIRSPDANAYFKGVFESDWNKTSQAYSNERTAAARSAIVGCPQLPGSGLNFQPGATPGSDSFGFF